MSMDPKTKEQTVVEEILAQPMESVEGGSYTPPDADKPTWMPDYPEGTEPSNPQIDQIAVATRVHDKYKTGEVRAFVPGTNPTGETSSQSGESWQDKQKREARARQARSNDY